MPYNAPLTASATSTGIGTLNESALHAALKEHYRRAGDALEAPVEGFVADIRRGNTLIEIQTASFGAMARKFDLLLDRFEMLLVHPVEVETYLQRPGKKTRKSPARGHVLQLFSELVAIPTLLDHPNLSLDVVCVSVLRVQKKRGHRYRTQDRKLRKIIGTTRIETREDLAALLPGDLPPQFTTADIASCAQTSRGLAQQMAYCLRALDLVEVQGRTRAGIHYARR